jgi:hypothetical protein
MTNYAIIENGVVVNAVVAEPEYAVSQGWVELPTGAGIGNLYDGSSFTAPTPVVVEPPAAPTKEELLAQLQTLTQQIQSLT